MITGFFLRIGFVVLQFFVAVLPTYPFPVGISNAIVTIGGYINAWSYIFPVSSLLAVLTVAMVFHGALLAWRLIHVVGRYLRGR